MFRERQERKLTNQDQEFNQENNVNGLGLSIRQHQKFDKHYFSFLSSLEKAKGRPTSKRSQ